MIDCQVVGVPDSLLTRLGFSLRDFIDTKEVVNDFLGAQAIRRVQSACLGHDVRTLCVGHSGGKDSVLVRWLTDQVPGLKDNVWSIHNPKLEGPNAVHGITQRFLYSMDGPTWFFKGNPMNHGFKVQIDGTRKFEAERLDGRSTDFVRDGLSVPRTELTPLVKSGLFGMAFCYPIYDWTDIQVWAAIDLHSIPYSREYLAI